MASRTEVAKTRDRILELRIQGVPVTQIATAVGLSVRTVYQHLDRAVEAKDATKRLATYADNSLTRLEKLIEIAWPMASATGKYDGSDPSKEWADFVVSCDKEIRKLLGLDAPRRVDIHAIVEQWAIREGIDPIDLAEVAPGIFEALNDGR